ncbi:MAG: hypothetical protein ACTSU5_02450 [Promethearchaeota archaeon]
MEELIRVKDEEIAKLKQIKEMLTKKFRDQKETIERLERELEEAKNAPPDLRKQSMDLKMEIQDLMDDAAKTPEIPKMEDSVKRAPAIGLSKEIAQQVAALNKAVAKIDEKIDGVVVQLGEMAKALEEIQARPDSGASAGSIDAASEAGTVAGSTSAETRAEVPVNAPSGKPGVGKRHPSDLLRDRGSGTPVDAGAGKGGPSSGAGVGRGSATAAPEVEAPTPRPRRPSDILKAQQEAAGAGGGSGADQVAQAPSGGPAEVEAPAGGGAGSPRPRRPSDVLKAQGEPQPAAPEPAPEGGGEAQPRATPEGIHSTKLEIPYPPDGVVKCPKCGRQDYKEMEDRSVVVSFVPVRKYGRKFYCKQCRTEWAYKY